MLNHLGSITPTMTRLRVSDESQAKIWKDLDKHDQAQRETFVTNERAAPHRRPERSQRCHFHLQISKYRLSVSKTQNRAEDASYLFRERLFQPIPIVCVEMLEGGSQITKLTHISSGSSHCQIQCWHRNLPAPGG